MKKSLKWIILGLLGLMFAIIFVACAPENRYHRQNQAASNSSNDKTFAVGETLVRPALDGIFEAFETHPLVGISDSHGYAQEEDLYAAIIRDPRFAREVGNVVVEFGAAGRQDVIDRYVAGEDVPYQELRTVWTDQVGSIPILGHLGYVQFFAQVRETNKALPPDERIHVWLGEPPLDWSKVESDKSPNLWQRAMSKRDSYPASLIVENILAQDKKALVLYGGLHFGIMSLRAHVEATYPDAFFIVLVNDGTLQPEACAKYLEEAYGLWPTPVLAAPVPGGAPEPELCDCATIDLVNMITKGQVNLKLKKNESDDDPAEVLGNAPPMVFGDALPMASGDAPPMVLGDASTEASGDSIPKVLGDAVLFLGPVEDIQHSPMMPDFYLDADYRREVSRRLEIKQGRPLFTVPPDFSLERAVYEFDLDAPGYAEMLEAMFSEYDLDQDGVVTADEYVDPIQR